MLYNWQFHNINSQVFVTHKMLTYSLVQKMDLSLVLTVLKDRLTKSLTYRNGSSSNGGVVSK